MSETAITAETLSGPRALEATVIAWSAADIVEGNAYSGTGREIILARNDGEAAGTVILSGAPDWLGRDLDLELSIAAGETVALLPALSGWRQSDGRVLLAADTADIKLAILRLPTE